MIDVKNWQKYQKSYYAKNKKQIIAKQRERRDKQVRERPSAKLHIPINSELYIGSGCKCGHRLTRLELEYYKVTDIETLLIRPCKHGPPGVSMRFEKDHRCTQYYETWRKDERPI